MINIQDIIPYLEAGWVAMDKDGCWCWYSIKPTTSGDCWIFGKKIGNYQAIDLAFNIAPADDWTQSLIKVGGNDE